MAVTDRDTRDKLVAQVQKLAKLKKTISSKDDELTRLRAVEAYLEQDLIPDLMKDLEMDEVKTGDVKVSLATKVTANITEANKEEAYAWLDGHDEGGMIKRQIVVGFGRDKEKEAAKLYSDLGLEYEDVSKTCSVHAGTLAAWVRRRLKEGKEIPKCISFIELPFAKIKIGK